MPTLHSLLVAINDYHPSSGVSSLAGCVNDLKAMQQFLKKEYTDLKPKIKILLNEQATREAVIKTFRSHLTKNAKKGDTVLLYYAGHGSQTKTAAPFTKFDSIAKDETFVCYDSRIPGHHDLTDKELAVLLSEIKAGVHTVVIADSCHSASVTRTTDGERNPIQDPAASFKLAKKRFTSGTSSNRSIKSYLLSDKNYYATLGKNITIPHSRHILLSACNRDEEAWETTERRGLFSTTLMEVLKNNTDISYSDLFARVRTRVYNTAKNQMPTMYPLDGFNPNSVFLRANTKPNPKRHQIKQVNGKWRMEMGAIDGMPVNAKEVEQLIIGIYEDSSKSRKQIGSSGIDQILLKDSILSTTTTLKANKLYWGEIQSFPTALVVNMIGAKNHIKALNSLVKKLDSFPFVKLVEGEPKTKYALRIAKDKLSIERQEDGSLIHGIKKVNLKTIPYILETLTKIENWERITQLENSATSFKKNAVNVLFIDESDETKPVKRKESTITLDYPKQGADKVDGHAVANFYRIQVNNTTSKKLFVSLVHVGPDFAVTTHYPCGEISPKSGWIEIDNEHGLAISSKKLNETTDVFKVIVSTEAFDDYKFQQEGFEVGTIKNSISTTRATVNRRKSSQGDWYTKTIKVNTIRKQSTLGRSVTTLGKIRIQGHKKFQADIAVAPINANTRSLHPIAEIAAYFDPKDLIDIDPSNTRSGNQDQSIIEMSGIKNAAALAKDPLILKVDASLNKDGLVIPVTMANGFIVPLGSSLQIEDGSTEIRINKIPQGIDAPPNAKGKRSVGKALWFCFLKIAGFDDQVFSLKKVQYKNGNVDLTAVNKRQVDAAKKAIIVTHGIIGNSKALLKNLSFLQEEGGYDLILAFDYENLNTPLEDVAAQLNKKLESLGFSNNDGKILDILVHSTGGLVVRYLIEQIRKGDALVDNLWMVGTPNGGTIVGDVAALKNKILDLLAVGMNFGQSWMGYLKPVVEIINKSAVGTKYLSVALEQIKSDSPFIKKLNEGKKIKTKYTVIAGDMTNYQSVKNKRLARFFEKVLTVSSSLAHGNQPNDVIVTVHDAQKIPALIGAKKHKISCHHLNFLETEQGLGLVRKIIRE